jgi:rSAM/selenodomain-associated transferase 1
VTVSPTPSVFRILDPAKPEPAFAARCALTVMAKAPVPGKVKTRLSPPLTPAEAATLNAAFLRDTLANLGAAAGQTPADCVVSYTPVGQEQAFEGILPATTLLLPQRGDGFGERLLATASDLFRCGYSAVCLIDSDSPTVPAEAFVQAVQTLLQGADPGAEPVVLGWSDDGGYYLIGLTRPHARLFADIAWSTDAVSRQTEERAAELGLPLTRLTTWYDVDDAQSLARLQAEMRGDPGVPAGYAAEHTRQCLQHMGSVHGLR